MTLTAYQSLAPIAARMTTVNADCVRVANLALAAALLHSRGRLGNRSRAAPDGRTLFGYMQEIALSDLPELDSSQKLLGQLAGCARLGLASISRWTHLHDWITAAQDLSHDRKSKGAYATPIGFAQALVAQTLRPVTRSSLCSVVDPSCGAGALLLASLRLLSADSGTAARERALKCIVGVELDPGARELACLLLTIAADSPAVTVHDVAKRVLIGNALTLEWRTLLDQGADALVMNPPWESLRHSVGDPGLSTERDASVTRLRSAVDQRDGLPPLFSAQGRGDRNLYKAFMELAPHVVRDKGRIGALVPAAFASDLGVTALRRLYLDHVSIDRWTSFENIQKHFPIDSRYKFGVLTGTKQDSGTRMIAVRGFAFSALELDAEHVTLTRSELDLLGGEVLAIPDFTSRDEVDILARMLRSGDRFFGKSSLGCVRYRREVDMTFGFRDGRFWRYEDAIATGSERLQDGSMLLSSGRRVVPLVEGRMVGQFDPFQKSWVAGSGRTAQWQRNGLRSLRECVPQFVSAAGEPNARRVALCDVTSATNTRTVHATLVPDEWPCGNTAPVLEFESERMALAGVVVLNSLVFDWMTRRVVSGLHLNKFYLDMLAWPRLSSDATCRLSHIALELYALAPRQLPRVNGAIRNSVVTIDQPTSFSDFVTLHTEAELLVAEGFGLDGRSLRTMLTASKSDRRGFWRHFKSEPRAGAVVNRILSLSGSRRSIPDNTERALEAPALVDC